MDPVFKVEKDDPEMIAAIKAARRSFRRFLRIVDPDLQRIIPVLTAAMVKIYVPLPQDQDTDTGEHIWCRYLGPTPEDPKRYLGEILNKPRRLKPLTKGDHIDFSVRSLSDWLYVEDDEAIGAYTVQLLRQRMTRAQRKKHDAAYPFRFADV